MRPINLAVHHGLMAETVIGAPEDAEDYKAFEALLSRITMPSRPSSPNRCCGSLVYCGGCDGPRRSRLACSKIQADDLAELRNERQIAPNFRYPICLFREERGCHFSCSNRRRGAQPHLDPKQRSRAFPSTRRLTQLVRRRGRAFQLE